MVASGPTFQTEIFCPLSRGHIHQSFGDDRYQQKQMPSGEGIFKNNYLFIPEIR
jgi:hypothetical protein